MINFENCSSITISRHTDIQGIKWNYTDFYYIHIENGNGTRDAFKIGHMYSKRKFQRAWVKRTNLYNFDKEKSMFQNETSFEEKELSSKDIKTLKEQIDNVIRNMEKSQYSTYKLEMYNNPKYYTFKR